MYLHLPIIPRHISTKLCRKFRLEEVESTWVTNQYKGSIVIRDGTKLSELKFGYDNHGDLVNTCEILLWGIKPILYIHKKIFLSIICSSTINVKHLNGYK